MRDTSQREIRMTATLVSKDRGASWQIIKVTGLGGTERVKPTDFEGMKLVRMEY
jgi:hypothetical protein